MDVTHHAQLYVGSEDPNTDPHTCVASALKPCVISLAPPKLDVFNG